MTRSFAPTRWELEFETTSPLFLGGASPNERAELRAPSLRGALRAWYRLLVGPEIAARGLGDGRLSESSIFGGTASGEGQGRLVLRLPEPVIGQKFWKAPQDQTEASAYRPGAGANYLGFSLAMHPNSRKAIPAGTRLKVHSVHPRGLPDEVAVRLVASWWLLSALGGLGTRARRGFGSLVMTRWPARATHLDGTPAPTQFPTLPTLHDLRSVEMLRAALEQGMRLILSKVRPVDAAERTFEARQAVYRLDTTCELMVVRARGQAWDGPLRALEALGQHMSAFRRARHAVGLPTAPLQMLESGQSLPRAPAPAAFGLPLSYQRKGERTQYSLGPSQRWRPPSDDPSRPPSVGRMPSPILISLKRIGMGEGAEVVAVITRLSGEVPGVKLDLAHDRDPYRDIPANPGNAILQDYMKDLASNFNVQKVRL